MNQRRFKTAAVFGSHMVLQRGKEIAVFGTGEEGLKLAVRFGEHRRETRVENGKWLLRLPPMGAGGPYTMTVTDEREELRFDDVLVGEVWLAGGQSNMEMELRSCENGAEETARANWREIRFYNVLKTGWLDEKAVEEEEKRRWKPCVGETCGEMSAAAYFYAVALQEALRVPVGIIGCYYGGTSISAWMSEPALRESEAGISYMDRYSALVGNKTERQYEAEVRAFEEKCNAWRARAEKLKEENPAVSWGEIREKAGEYPWPRPAGKRAPYRPAALYEAMLSRLRPYAIRGFLYYQGEEDTAYANTYGSLLCRLIRLWRGDWNDETLPFLIVQLPMFRPSGERDDRRWALLREQQYDAFRALDHTGLVVLSDCGEADNIHPLDKKTVGHRLALQSLEHVYGLPVHGDAPYLKSVKRDRDGLRLSFENLYGGLTEKGGELVGFELAGEDRLYAPAAARIEGTEIVLNSPRVGRPQSARYAWANYCKVNLYNRAGLPVMPFRTDRF